MLYIVYIKGVIYVKIEKKAIPLDSTFEGFDSVYQITQRYMATIAKKTDYVLRQQIIQYAKLKSQEYGEDVQVIFMDEEKVNRIIDLGLKEYLSEERGYK